MSSGMSTVPCIGQLQLYDTYQIAGFCNIFVVFLKNNCLEQVWYKIFHNPKHIRLPITFISIYTR